MWGKWIYRKNRLVFYCLSLDSDWNKLVRGVSCLFELQMKKWHLFSLCTSPSQGKCLYSASGKEKDIIFSFCIQGGSLVEEELFPWIIFISVCLKLTFTMSHALPNFVASVLYPVVSSCPLLWLSVFKSYLRDKNAVGQAFLHLWEKCPSVIWALKSNRTLDNTLCMQSVFITCGVYVC